MGLLDIFKKKEQPQELSLFETLSRYSDYFTIFVINQQRGNYSPISAYEKSDGAIEGHLYMNGEDTSYTISADDVVMRMKDRFAPELSQGVINSYVIFHHQDFLPQQNSATGVMTVDYQFKDSFAGTLRIPYQVTGENQVAIQGIIEFTPEQNNVMFNAQLTRGQGYFTDRTTIAAPVTTNDIGLKITCSNNYNLGDSWSAIFGFDTAQTPHREELLEVLFKDAVSSPQQITTKGKVSVAEAQQDDWSARVILLGNSGLSVMPVVKTEGFIEVENVEINEWENTSNLEAVISGRGRDTFGITYFATDYALNKDVYLSERNHDIKITGLVYVLDKYTKEAGNDFSEDFTGYLPHKELAKAACFDFIGEVEEVTRAMAMVGGDFVQGYIMKVRLITHPDRKDMFTIDMYVHAKNMRFEELEVGMKVTGMFRMQGEIA